MCGYAGHACVPCLWHDRCRRCGYCRACGVYCGPPAHVCKPPPPARFPTQREYAQAGRAVAKALEALR